MKELVTIKASINASVEKVWKYFTEVEHIKRWNNATSDWHTPYAENDLRVGGKFLYRMEARDGSQGFDFPGTYDEVIMHQKIAYTLDDTRKVKTTFNAMGDVTEVVQQFEAENVFPIEMQRSGWQSILDNLKKYVEEN